MIRSQKNRDQLVVFNCKRQVAVTNKQQDLNSSQKLGWSWPKSYGDLPSNMQDYQRFELGSEWKWGLQQVQAFLSPGSSILAKSMVLERSGMKKMPCRAYGKHQKEFHKGFWNKGQFICGIKLYIIWKTAPGMLLCSNRTGTPSHETSKDHAFIPPIMRWALTRPCGLTAIHCQMKVVYTSEIEDWL